eukprot:TRINITY_DN4624_c0_g1_i3.p1 TRINITY_DN4624_c0_g1~~TRINITY_DN4624_c0_g1_i3.p1  ORF type:complete len:336 (+),score=142.16 TRINITY_DN4624_c0_g1_i3:103-1008(+)
MVRSALAAAVFLLTGASAQSLHNALSDAQLHNLDFHQAPAFELANVTFSLLFFCQGNTQCWNNNNGNGMYTLFNRENFRAGVTAAVNWQAGQLSTNPFAMNQWSNFHVDRIVESTSPTPGASTYGGRYNVMVRITLSDIPVEIANDFMPVITYLFGTSGAYNSNVAMLQWDSVWVSTQAYFIDNQLEPFRGRGHKPQMLLIPLMLGLSFMLIIPIGVVACAVAQENQLKIQAKALAKEELKGEKLARELADKEMLIHAHQKKEDEDIERAKKLAADREAAAKREIQEGDTDWVDPYVGGTR